MSKEALTVDLSKAVGIHLYKVAGNKVLVRPAGEALPPGCEEGSGNSWSDRFFDSSCSDTVRLLNIILMHVSNDKFDAWWNSIDSELILNRIECEYRDRKKNGNHRIVK